MTFCSQELKRVLFADARHYVRPFRTNYGISATQQLLDIITGIWISLPIGKSPARQVI